MEQMPPIYKMGTAYYPDYAAYQRFDLSNSSGKEIDVKKRIDQDIDRMRSLGLSEMRIGEFSWSTVEPEEGRYNPDIFLYALDKAHSAGIEVIFCTPTATPPKWLIDKHPDILPVLADDRKLHFGSRRHYDPCNPQFEFHTKMITEYFVKTFGKHPAVSMWQIDNELGHHGSSSMYTAYAQEKFQKFLKNKYSEISVLNHKWFTCFWSQGYTSFEQIEVPRSNWADENPHCVLDFRRFCTKIYKDYQKIQIDIIKSHSPSTKITHNLISNFYELCPWEMTEDLETIGFDHYQDFDYPTPVRSASNFSLMGSLAKKNTSEKFKILEQQPVQVNWQKINRRFPFDWLLLWAGQSSLFGADTMDYFSWQKFYGGSEQYHDGVLPHDVRNKKSSQEKLIEATSKMFKSIACETSWGRVPSTAKQILVIHNTESLWSHRITCQSEHYDAAIQLDDLTELFTRCGLGFELNNEVPNLNDLKNYKAIVFPGYAFELSTSEKETLSKFSDAGGAILTFPRSLMKTKDNFMSPLPLSLFNKEDFYFEEYGAMGPEEEEIVETNDGLRISTSRWAEKIVLTNTENCSVLAKYSTGLYEGSPAILRFGKSHYHFSFCPKNQAAFGKFLLEVIPSDVVMSPAPTNVQIVPLDSGEFGIVNFSNESKQIETKFSKIKPLIYTLDRDLKLEIQSGNEIKGGNFKVPKRSFTVVTTK